MKISLELSALHEKQQLIVDHPARHKIVVCGRRFGKSEIAYSEILETILSGQPVGYFTPTYRLGSELWRRTLLGLAPIISVRNKSERYLEFITGGQVDFWSVDNPTAGRSRKYKLAIIDEAAFVKDPNFFNEVIMPTLADLQGRSLTLTTPKGRGWVYQLFNRGQDPLLANKWKSWNFPTVANPYILDSEVEEARLSLPRGVFEQEYLGLFKDDTTSVFRNIQLASTIKEKQQPKAGRFSMGIDYARQNDYSVITIFDMSGVMVDYDRFNHVDWLTQRMRIHAMARRWKPEIIVSESNSIGGVNEEILRQEGLPIFSFYTSGKSKPPLINNLALAFELMDVQIIDHPVIVNEFHAYQQNVTKAGNTTYSAPSGLHDDIVVSCCLAWHGLLILRSQSYQPPNNSIKRQKISL